MRRSVAILALALMAASCTDEPGGDVVVGAFDQGTSTSIPTPTSAPTTTEPPSVAPSSATSSTSSLPPTSTTSTTTTLAPPTATVVEWLEADEEGLCGDRGVPVRLGGDQTCRDPETLPPDPVASGTPWELPIVDAASPGEYWWHPPLALLNWNTVSLYTVDDPFSWNVRPWAVIDQWADALAVAADGTLVVEQWSDDETGPWPWVDVAVYHPDGTPPEVIENSHRLHDVDWHGQLEGVLYEPHPVDEYDPDEEVPFLLVPLGESRPGDPAFGLVERADAVYWGADLLGPRALVEGYAGDSSVLEVRDLDGKVLFEVDVLDGHDPEMPPSIGAAAWSSDGTRITWIEYPYDPPGAADEPTRVKSVAVATGELIFSIPLGADVYPTFNPVHSIHDLGTHVVINTLGFAANTWWPEPATILSFTADEPELWQLPVTGVAVPVPYVVG